VAGDFVGQALATAQRDGERGDIEVVARGERLEEVRDHLADPGPGAEESGRLDPDAKA
jgi:hypothetical protein